MKSELLSTNLSFETQLSYSNELVAPLKLWHKCYQDNYFGVFTFQSDAFNYQMLCGFGVVGYSDIPKDKNLEPECRPSITTALVKSKVRKLAMAKALLNCGQGDVVTSVNWKASRLVTDMYEWSYFVSIDYQGGKLSTTLSCLRSLISNLQRPKSEYCPSPVFTYHQVYWIAPK